MSSFVWMKVLESTPDRYDLGIRMLSRDRIDEVYERIATLVAAPGKRILDIGCGTGALSLACAARGAAVTGIDINAGMLEVARSKPVPGQGSVAFLELGAAEIGDRFAETSLDAVVACLTMSELSPQEQSYVLRLAHAHLVPGGMIAIADETLPQSSLSRLAHWLWRLPLVALTYLLTQTTTQPLRDLRPQLQAAGFTDIIEERMWSDSFVIIHALKEGSS